jgi:hypothetical protein
VEERRTDGATCVDERERDHVARVAEMSGMMAKMRGIGGMWHARSKRTR